MRRIDSYAAWLDRHRVAVLALSVIVVGLVVALGRVPLHADLSSLLPPSRPSVQDLEVLKGRARAFGNVLIMLEAPTAVARARAAPALEAQLRDLDPALVSAVSTDDGAAARYGWAHRFLFVELADLRAAIAALEERLTRERLEANPLFIDLEEPSPAPADDRAAELERRFLEAEEAASAPPMRLSPDGRSQLFLLQVTFPPSDVRSGRIVMTQVRALAERFEAAHPGIDLELAGSINIAIYEHDSVISGTALAAVLTVLLCGLALLYYFRSLVGVLAVLWALFVGIALTLGFTAVTIGHLNLMTAFLAAIIVGNGINTGLLVLSRYLEELRGGRGARDALGPALAGALPGTLAAALAASVAYGSMIVTDFRGFRHFGIIGAFGMLACWLAAYTVLPAMLAVLARRQRIRPATAPRITTRLALLLPARPRRVVLVAGLVMVSSLVITIAYVATDPFAKDWRKLQSDGPDIQAQRAIDARMSARFDRKVLSGHSFQLVIAVERRDQVRPLVAQIRAAEARRPPEARLFAEIWSIEDVVPPDQDAKIALLGRVRALLADPAIAQLPDAERARFERLRPPDIVTPITERDVPDEVRWPFVEQDGTVGRLIYLKGSPRFRTWYIEDRIAFAEGVREIEVPPGTRIGGEPLVIADIVASMHDDAPKMIVFSLLGSMVGVFLIVGRRRHGVVTVLCGFSGVLLMIALCAVVDLSVHFLDVIALPITIGIGIDYAVNLAARDRQEGERGPRHLLATTGGAVLLCSYTTTVGYGSLLLSTNGGIRAFGLAALLGEIACLVMALLLAPSLLALWRARDQRQGVVGTVSG